MMEKIKNWLKDQFSVGEPEPTPPQNLSKSGVFQQTRPAKRKASAAKPKSVPVEVETSLHGHVESIGPGKNVLIRNRLVREETGTHETLRIVNDSVLDSGEASGIDPYNTGGFDRSKKWDQRFRK